MSSSSIVLFPLLILAVFMWMFPSCRSYHDPKFQLSLEKLQYDGVNPTEIMTWWEQIKTLRLANASRVFPICISYSEGNGWPPKVSKFSSYFATLDKLKAYDPQIHSWKFSERKMLSKIEVRTVTVKVENGKDDDDEKKKSVALNQWLGFTLTIKENVKGIYVQSVVGPLGIPAGEFNVDDFRCKSGIGDDRRVLRYQHIVPCSYTPRAIDVHPNAFVIDASESTANVALPSRFTFRYRWAEAQCQETGFFQFIIIATIDFENFESVLSPIYHLPKMVSLSGLPTPYHPHYSGVTCAPQPNKKIVNIIDDGTRIIPNKQYDECVVNGVGRGETDLDRFTCPPGHFKCATIWKTATEWVDLKNKWWSTIVKKLGNFRDCCEVGPIKPPPPTTTTTTTEKLIQTTLKGTPSAANTTEEPLLTTTKKLQPPLIVLQIQAQYLKGKSKRTEKENQISHGDLCIFTWLVLVPIANHAARFLKDIPDFKSVGLGLWIILHVALHSIGIILIWVSFGLVIGSGEDKLGNVSGRHFLLGVLCTSLQHLQFVTGLKRDHTERVSFYYVLTHSLSGYISHFFGYVSVFLSNADTQRKWVSMGFFIIWLAGIIASYLVEKKQDKLLGVVFHRAQCPILQRIVLENRQRPPLMRIKLVILLLLCLGQGLLFALIIFKFNVHTTARMKLNRKSTLARTFDNVHDHLVADDAF